MTDKTKKILKWTGAGIIAAGAIIMCVGTGIGCEILAMEVVGGIFAIAGIIIAIIGKFKKK